MLHRQADAKLRGPTIWRSSAMNNLQRGIYQPLADKVPIYDLADEDPEEERSRAPLLVVIALVVLAAFAGRGVACLQSGG